MKDRWRELAAVIVICAFFFVAGSIAGWFAKGMTTRDRYLFNAADLMATERLYYSAEYQKLKKEYRP